VTPETPEDHLIIQQRGTEGQGIFC